MSDIPREDLDRMARIEAKVDTVIAHLAEAPSVTLLPAETEKRLGSLEKWRYATGGAFFISLASIVTSLANSTPR
ncbi:hypothetical protein [Streptomyces virginiae]|uniref:hypothetical protein n=1 Tax=Streptomyces virginiae TaxID=1961 RepID=UPI00224FE1DB|nr:hypothetical protein [Streptomyces virginiae]MCX4962975.1 hypothetical protein [Streptomyces virginiae]